MNLPTTADASGLHDYLKVAKVDDLPAGSMMTVAGLDLVDVLVINFGGNYYAISGVCTHKGAPLRQGSVDGKYIVCPWHKANFRLADGQHYWPADRPIRSFSVKIEDGYIYVQKRKQQQFVT